MSAEATAAVWRYPKGTTAERMLLLALANRADEEGVVTETSVARLAANAGMTERGARGMLTRFRGSGLLELIDEGGGRGRTNTYRLVLPDLQTRNETDETRNEEPEKHSQTRNGEPGIPPHTPPGTVGTLGNDTPPTPPDGARARPRDLFADYLEILGKRRREPGEDELRIIRAAQKAGSDDEIRHCFRACAASDYHLKRGKHRDRRGGKYDGIGKILKPRPTKGETQRSRIEWWLDRPVEQAAGGERRFTHPSRRRT